MSTFILSEDTIFSYLVASLKTLTDLDEVRAAVDHVPDWDFSNAGIVITSGGTQETSDDNQFVRTEFTVDIGVWRRAGKIQSNRQGGLLLEEDPSIPGLSINNIRRLIRAHLHGQFARLSEFRDYLKTVYTDFPDGTVINTPISPLRFDGDYGPLAERIASQSFGTSQFRSVHVGQGDFIDVIGYRDRYSGFLTINPIS